MTTSLHPEVWAWLRAEHGAPAGPDLITDRPALSALSEELQALAVEDWPADGFTPAYLVDWMRPPREWLRGEHDVDGLGEYLLGLGWILVGETGGCGDFLLVRNHGRPMVAFGHMPLLVGEGQLATGTPPHDKAIVESPIDIYNCLERLMALSVGLDEAFEEEDGERYPSYSFLPFAAHAWGMRDEKSGIAVLPHFTWAEVSRSSIPERYRLS
ncbi:MAG: hypothetical protein AAGA20_05660 [Planctomycetota bacterium]